MGQVARTQALDKLDASRQFLSSWDRVYETLTVISHFNVSSQGIATNNGSMKGQTAVDTHPQLINIL